MAEATISTDQLRRILDAVLEAAEPVAGGHVREHMIGLRKALTRADAKRAETAPASAGLDWHGLRDVIEGAIADRLVRAWPDQDRVFLEQAAAEAARAALGVPLFQRAAANGVRIDDCGVCDLVPTGSGYVRGVQVSCPVHGEAKR